MVQKQRLKHVELRVPGNGLKASKLNLREISSRLQYKNYACKKLDVLSQPAARRYLFPFILATMRSHQFIGNKPQ